MWCNRVPSWPKVSRIISLATPIWRLVSPKAHHAPILPPNRLKNSAIWHRFFSARPFILVTSTFKSTLYRAVSSAKIRSKASRKRLASAIKALNCAKCSAFADSGI